MENTQLQGQPIIALLMAGISITSGTFASIIGNVELIVRIAAGIVAMVSGAMAIRYYYFATKKVMDKK